MAGEDDSVHPRDSKGLDPPSPKKQKLEAEKDEGADTEAEDSDPEETKARRGGYFYYKGRKISRGTLDDEECTRQRTEFYRQLRESEGFDVDWDSFDYIFTVVNFDWQQQPIEEGMSNEELIKFLSEAAMKEHDEEYGTQLKYDKYVSANLYACKGLMYLITFMAHDLKSSNQESKFYQAKVWKFGDEIRVKIVRLRPTQ